MLAIEACQFDFPGGRVSILGYLNGRIMMASANTPELPELTENNFKLLTPEANRIFSFRAATRVLPLLGGTKETLEFWPADDQKKNLSTIIAATDIVLLSVVGEGVSSADIIDYVVSAAHGAAKTANDNSTVVAIAYAAGAVDASSAARYVTYAMVTKHVASLMHEAVNISMRLDLQKLLKWCESLLVANTASSDIDPKEYLFAPLWQRPDGRNGLPKEWDEIMEHWKPAMLELGMEDIVLRYKDLVDGKPWSIDETERRFNAWYEKYGKESDTNNNTHDEIQDHSGKPADNKFQKKVEAPNIIKTASVANPNSDHSTTEDALGREALVKALVAFLDHQEYKGQNTIGLLGHWGAGKSSVLNMLENALSENPQNGFNKPKTKYLCATFNAWAYEHTDNIQAGLAQEVVKGLTKKLRWRDRLDLSMRHACKSQPARFVWVAVGLPVVLTATVFAFSVDETLYGVSGMALLLILGRQFTTVISHPLAEKLLTYLRLPSFGKHLGELPVIQQQVKDLCELVLFPSRERGCGDSVINPLGYREKLRTWIINRKESDQRLLLMVDDLDRCGEDGIVKTLEAVKLVMDLPNVTTIIAVDHRMALAALSVHYHNLAEKGSDRTAHAIARDYLGKIFTLPIQLDTPGDTEIGEYLDKVLFVNLDEEPAEKVSAPVALSHAPNEPKAPERGEPAKDKVPPVASGSTPTTNVASPETDDAMKEPEQVDEEVVMVDEVVKDSRDERKLFAELSKALKITNPRQLKRLHNSYRLLKALSFHQGLNKARLKKDERERLMAMLFWMERISCLDQNERKEEESFMRLRVSERPSSVDELKLESAAYYEIKRRITLSRDEIFEDSKENYDELKERVKVFMLPFADISSGDNAENGNKQ